MKAHYFGEPNPNPFARTRRFLRRVPSWIRWPVFGPFVCLIVVGGFALAFLLCKAGRLGRRIAHAYGVDSDGSW
jgi:hypothetical protein